VSLETPVFISLLCLWASSAINQGVRIAWYSWVA